MKKYVDLVLKKEKRAISFQQIMEKIAKILQEENIELTDEMKEEVQSVLDSLVSSYDVYKTPSQNYILMSKTTFRKGKFYGERSGSGKVSVTTSYVDKFGSFVVNEDKYAIGSDRTNGAIDGDFVLIDGLYYSVRPIKKIKHKVVDAEYESPLFTDFNKMMDDLYNSGKRLL